MWPKLRPCFNLHLCSFIARQRSQFSKEMRTTCSFAFFLEYKVISLCATHDPKWAQRSVQHQDKPSTSENTCRLTMCCLIRANSMYGIWVRQEPGPAGERLAWNWKHFTACRLNNSKEKLNLYKIYMNVTWRSPCVVLMTAALHLKGLHKFFNSNKPLMKRWNPLERKCTPLEVQRRNRGQPASVWLRT